MIPIHKLLSRIRWDRDFGRGQFEIGYYDRLQKEIVRVPMTEIHFVSGDSGNFQVMDHEGVIHSIPLHRIREVYRNSVLIWKRPAEKQ